MIPGEKRNRLLDTGLVAGYAGSKSLFQGIDIEGDMNVQFTNTGLFGVNAGGIAGHFAENAGINVALIDCNFVVTADMLYDYNADNSVKLGGAVGYAEPGSDFQNIIVATGMVVDAQSEQTPVYVGGVLGRGLQITITGAESGASVFGSGPAYNTSAGGVAGYIQFATVTESSASGDITLNAPWVGGQYNFWQIYAGGLVGYSGGTAVGNSVIVHSHATGAVSAIAPYPYGGGLVGYNYGYAVYTPDEWLLYYCGLLKDTATVTSNGSLIIRSYATGSVTATATANGLPYAGGLAGYSSIPPTNVEFNIENCYATGNVSATTDSQYAFWIFFWGGGVRLDWSKRSGQFRGNILCNRSRLRFDGRSTTTLCPARNQSGRSGRRYCGCKLL
jgi:hypothetical protein